MDYLNGKIKINIMENSILWLVSIHVSCFPYMFCFLEDSLGIFLTCLQNLLVVRILYFSFTVIAAPET